MISEGSLRRPSFCWGWEGCYYSCQNCSTERADLSFEQVSIFPTQPTYLARQCGPIYHFLVIFGGLGRVATRYNPLFCGAGRPAIWTGHEILNPTRIFGGTGRANPTDLTHFDSSSCYLHERGVRQVTNQVDVGSEGKMYCYVSCRLWRQVLWVYNPSWTSSPIPSIAIFEGDFYAIFIIVTFL